MLDQEMLMNSEEHSSEGYCIKIAVLKNGFTVSDPKPLEATDEESDTEYQDADGELIPDLPTMLKNVMAVIKENPVAGGEEEGFASVGMVEPKM